MEKPRKMPTQVSETALASQRGRFQHGINMAAEGTEISKVRTFAGANLIWSLVTTAVWSNIVQADEVVERVGPEPWSKVGTTKHRTHGVGDILMWAFNYWTIHMG